MPEAFRPVDVTRVRGRARASDIDRAATEEPLEIRLHGRAFAVIMRTPGADRELAAGFLLAERVIRSIDDLGAIEYCSDRDDGAGSTGDVVNVTMDPARTAEALARIAARRDLLAGSACGVCGRATL